jgi:predicted ATP-binding protein involved in virulence
VRVSIEDAREIPTLKMPYGATPVTHASAGVRRVLALAYLLVWAWQEHLAASELLNQEPDDRLVLLFDEVETHLHPKWQRLILPAILRAMQVLRSQLSVQLIASTHAPLVLASVETVFDGDQDRVITFELEDGQARARQVEWAKQGDVVGWLVSEAFGLSQARSREAERAIEAAEALMRGETGVLPAGLRTRDQIHQELARVLPGHDPFWPRWIVHVEERQGAAP